MVNSGAKVVRNKSGNEYLIIWDSGDVRGFTSDGEYIFGGNIAFSITDVQTIGDVILFIGVDSYRSVKTNGWNPETRQYVSGFNRYVD